MRFSAPPNARAFLITAVFALILEGIVALAFAWCVPIVVVSSQEKSALLSLIAEDYNRANAPRAGWRCAHIRIVRKSSGETEKALALGWDRARDGEEPVAWTPAATTWISLLRAHRTLLGQSDLLHESTPPITQSPLVLAMLRPMGEALGWPKASIGWADILDLAKHPAGWGSRGHPEWGPASLGKTNPNISTSGLHALIGAYFAGAGRTPVEADVSDGRVRQFIQDVELSVAHYSDAVSTFLVNLLDADERGAALKYVSAIAVEEKHVLDYNEGNPRSLVDDAPRIPPKVQLVAIYPKEATLVANHPYAILNAPWVDDVERRAAESFREHLLDPSTQQRFLRAGFRSHVGAPGPKHDEANGVIPQFSGVVLSSLPGTLIERIQSSWHELRKRVRVLIAIDVSAPMGERLAGGVTRLEAATQAASEALDELQIDDDVGIWIFGARVSSSAPYREIAPLGPLGARRQQLKDLLRLLPQPAGDTPIYATTRLATEHIAASYDPRKIDGVILITSGRDSGPENELQKLLRELRNQPESRRVRVFGLTYGRETTAVDAIAIASGGSAYAAENAPAIKEAITDLISNF